MFPVHIPVVPLLYISLNFLYIRPDSPICQFFITASGTHAYGCGEIDFYWRFRQDAGTDVPAVHDHIFPFRQFLLEFYQLFPYREISGNGGSHISHLLGSDQAGDIFSV